MTSTATTTSPLLKSCLQKEWSKIASKSVMFSFNLQASTISNSCRFPVYETSDVSQVASFFWREFNLDNRKFDELSNKLELAFANGSSVVRDAAAFSFIIGTDAALVINLEELKKRMYGNSVDVPTSVSLIVRGSYDLDYNINCKSSTTFEEICRLASAKLRISPDNLRLVHGKYPINSKSTPQNLDIGEDRVVYAFDFLTEKTEYLRFLSQHHQPIDISFRNKKEETVKVLKIQPYFTIFESLTLLAKETAIPSSSKIKAYHNKERVNSGTCIGRLGLKSGDIIDIKVIG